MTVLADTDREFWREVLLAGAATAVPRWTVAPVPGTGAVEVPVPRAVVQRLPGVAAALGVPVSALLLAAHARVLAALAGEGEVVPGLLLDGSALPCRIAATGASWRELAAAAERAAAAVRAHAGFPVEELRAELGLPPLVEVAVDPDGGGRGLPPGTLLAISFRRRGTGLAVEVRHRKDAVDAAGAARVAGYHRAALTALCTAPDADPRRTPLLSADERRLQLDGLAGRARRLPDRRVHELFEERAAIHPDAVAAVHRGRSLTYRELNARANRLARGLLARGVRREEIVAVVAERDLDWMTAVLGIWKAGAAYLPLEPHFPAGRIAAALTRADVRLVLTEPGCTGVVDAALAGLPGHRVLLADLLGEDHPDGDLGLPVGADQLAYVLFTSGSTGEPKGVLCEHAGMLNHVLAKLDDLGIGEGEVVPQTGPQCFDISVWQLVGALLVGGRTLLVEQETILDAERLVDTLVEHRAGVLQVVPSYLDVVLSYLEQHPRALPDLHHVSPTGDLLKRELVERWFAAQPGIPLVNTYGLTETSDDAVHLVLHGPRDDGRVPLGRPIPNTSVDVVDEHGEPVPLGAPGLIAFSGVCVGRGYVHDPARTAAVFGPDPHRPGQRVCRTGDSGRWLPDGTLEFLGRRDTQVKVRGFRIEIGEIESALLRIDGIRDGAVVVADRPDGNRALVACCAGPAPLPADRLRTALARVLPEYMLPSAFLWWDRLPLTGNGKVDRTALAAAAAAADGGVAERSAPPATPEERRLAAAWAAVLGVPAEQIGRHDSFVDLGGTSLSAVKLAVALDRALSLPEVLAVPVLADQAALLSGRS
ncbi:non-ribosomal peptide synthetase [Petropleomorpha daqingensis]|uniref:Amino acid adenylation domain-containing protein n=1 Tax=Petropleomorpha daqingensis TaxID=2026353 RepID=A0A853CPT2_9ACTN|nr:amino acid adenylation domain-containing protein [Petropleomorpha daqingensis]NYJ07943.1 amino acid adenylation domain-containing protein [Petropleomorpha daqingensis]